MNKEESDCLKISDMLPSLEERQVAVLEQTLKVLKHIECMVDNIQFRLGIDSDHGD